MSQLLTYKEKIKLLSNRIVEAQRPIRILDSIRWPQEFEKALIDSKFKTIPVLGPEEYQKIKCDFHFADKIAELDEIESAIKLELGAQDDLAQVMISMVDQYRDIVHLLKNRGTKKFWEYSRKLYGSPKDKIFEDVNTISDLGSVMYSILSKIEMIPLGKPEIEDIPAEQVVKTLNHRFKNYFQEDEVRAVISDGIIADAAAGGDTVKIKEGAFFSEREVNILEVHEGWVHVGTTLNGNAQHVAKFLSKGPPRCAATQEGLAIIMEIFSFRSNPKRAKQINDRILAIEKAENGANILELMEFYRTEGYSEKDSLSNVKRVFRGGLVEGGAPFTKDISYCRGFIENYNFMRTAVKLGVPHLIPFLFVGKVNVDDVPILYQKYQEGVIDAPKYLPEQFRDMNGIAVWMSFSNFFNMVDLKRVREHYEKLFK